MSKKVAIIGAGPSGITSAKYCSSYGLEPVVFDTKSSPGGLWVAGSKIWSTMYCNFTKYSMVFSDFPWPDDDSFHYPHRDQIYDYLQRYIDHFNIRRFFRLNTRVESATPGKVDNKPVWSLKWTCLTTGQTFQSDFDFLIIASGFNSIPQIPELENSGEVFKGLIMHSDSYKANDVDRLKDKRVLVIGSSNSSVEIASDLVGYAKSVVNLFRRPFWVIPKFIQVKSTESGEMITVPRDFIFYTREFSNSKERRKYAQLCPEQITRETGPSDLYIDAENKQPVNFGVSQNFYRHVKEGQIETVCNELKQYVPEGVQLADGSVIRADVILFCTGYKLSLPFFNPQSLSSLLFDENNYKNPIVLYKQTFHPAFPNVGFVFLTRGGFFAGLELQSKWTAMVFSGRKSLPVTSEMEKEIERNSVKRENTHPSVQFPHGLYVEVVDMLAAETDALPCCLTNNNNNDEMREYFHKFLVSPSNFIYNENKDYSIRMIRCAERISTEGVKVDICC